MGRKRTRPGKHVYLCITCLIFLCLSSCATLEKSKIRIEGHDEARQHLLRGQELLAQKDYDGYLNENETILSLSLRQPPEDEALYNIGLFYASPENPKRDHAKSLIFFKRLMEDYPQNPLADRAKIWMAIVLENGKLHQTVEKLNQSIENSKQADHKKEQAGEIHEALLRAQKLFAQGDYEGALKENQKILSLSLHMPPEDEALFNMGLIFAHSGNPKKDYVKSLHFFKKLMKNYPQSLWAEPAKVWTGMLQENEKLNQAVEKLNQSVEKLNQVIEKSKQVDIEIEEKKREKSK